MTVTGLVPNGHDKADAAISKSDRRSSFRAEAPDHQGSGTIPAVPAPQDGAPAVPPADGVLSTAETVAAAAPPSSADTFHDSTSSHHSHGNAELDFLEDWKAVGASMATTAAAAAASLVRRVLVPAHGVIKVASEDEDFSAADEDRASPTSVTAVPGDPKAVSNTTAKSSTNREPSTTTMAGVGGGSVEQELRVQLHAAELQRQKMVANLRKKKAQLEAAEGTQKGLEAKVSDLEASLAKLQTENDQLRAGLQKVVTTRDEMKNKIRIKNELLRELRADKDEAERRLRRSENQRATEQDLLANYRRLATHTGYFKWGKTIRVLEAALEQHNASAEANPAPGGGGNGGASGGGGSSYSNK